MASLCPMMASSSTTGNLKELLSNSLLFLLSTHSQGGGIQPLIWEQKLTSGIFSNWPMLYQLIGMKSHCMVLTFLVDNFQDCHNDLYFHVRPCFESSVLWVLRYHLMIPNSWTVTPWHGRDYLAFIQHTVALQGHLGLFNLHCDLQFENLLLLRLKPESHV